MMGLVFPSTWGVFCWSENQGGKDAATLAVHVLVSAIFGVEWKEKRERYENLDILIDGETESGMHM